MAGAMNASPSEPRARMPYPMLLGMVTIPPATPAVRSSRRNACASGFGGTRARDDDLRSIRLLAEDGDVGAGLAVLDPPAGDDPSRGEGLVRPQHVGELRVEAP